MKKRERNQMQRNKKGNNYIKIYTCESSFDFVYAYNI